jgi:pimeloyl-ACP methyl ester carboxylesterase
MHVELVRTVTSDGLRLDGALAAPLVARSVSEGSATAAILLHGVAGNFYTSSAFEPLIPLLQELGLAVLSVNTRGHDSVFGSMAANIRRRFGAAYETVDDCRLDIAAWIEFLASRGHERIVLIGHSLGAIKAVYGMAHEKWPQVTAIVAASPPRLSYSAFMNSTESSTFWESMSTAETMVAEKRSDELFTGKFPFPLLITAAGYVDKYGPSERYNILKYAAEIPSPALFAYGSKELRLGGVAFEGLPEALAELPSEAGREIVVIEGADHMYSGVADHLAAVVARWIYNRPLLEQMRSRVSQGAKASELLRWLHIQTDGPKMPLFDLIRIFQEAFDLKLIEVNPIGGWLPEIGGELRDEQIDAFLQPHIDVWRRRANQQSTEYEVPSTRLSHVYHADFN